MIGTEEARKYIEEDREQRKQAEQMRLAAHVTLINDLCALKGRILGQKEKVLGLRDAYTQREGSPPQGIRDAAIAFLEVMARDLPELNPPRMTTRRQVQQMATHAEIKEAFLRMIGAVFIVSDIIKEEYNTSANFLLSYVPFFSSLQTKPEGYKYLPSGSTLYKLIDENIFSISQVKSIFSDESQRQEAVKVLARYLDSSEPLFDSESAKDNIAFVEKVKVILQPIQQDNSDTLVGNLGM